jgi:hypothetical protein
MYLLILRGMRHWQPDTDGNSHVIMPWWSFAYLFECIRWSVVHVEFVGPSLCYCGFKVCLIVYLTGKVNLFFLISAVFVKYGGVKLL